MINLKSAMDKTPFEQIYWRGKPMSDILQRIIDAEKLVDLYSSWPAFSDGEIMWLKIEWKPEILPNKVSIEFLIHVLETHIRMADGSLKIVPDYLVHFAFSNCANIELHNFEHYQNMLFELEISVVKQTLLSDTNTPNILVARFEDNHWFTPEEILQVDFINSPSNFYGGFMCYMGKVVSVSPCDKEGNPLEKKTASM